MQTHLAGKAHKRRLANAQTLQSFQSSEGRTFSSSQGGNDEKATEANEGEKVAQEDVVESGQDEEEEEEETSMMKTLPPSSSPLVLVGPSLQCDICNVSVNSIQQLKIHYAGAKHKKATNKKKNVDDVTENSTTTNSTTSNLAFHSLDVELPDSIIRVEDPNKKVAGSYKCKSCDCLLNSEVQMRQVNSFISEQSLKS